MWEVMQSMTTVNEVNLDKHERWASLLGGVFFMLYALIRIPFTAVLALFTALYLFFRGIRGFCYLYKQLGRNTAVQTPKIKQQHVVETAVS